MSLGAEEGRVEKPPKGANARLGGGHHRCAGESWPVPTLMRGTQQIVYLSTYLPDID